MMYICKFCGKEKKNLNSLVNHERVGRCNPNRKLPVKTERFYAAMLKRRGIALNQFSKARLDGKTVPIVSAATIAKGIETRRRNGTLAHSEHSRKKLSEAMKRAVLNHPDSYSGSNVCGRTKIQYYRGEKFHGKWEVIVATWLHANNIRWERKITSPFKYQWNGGEHQYFPDFYLPDLDLYVEVKGYRQYRDECKWNAVPNLLVFQKAEILQILSGKRLSEYHMNMLKV